jgi:hypothetical protein
MDQVLSSQPRHIKLRKEVLNISNIPALNDIKPNFHIYGRLRVLEDEKAHKYNNADEEFGQQAFTSNQKNPAFEAA